MAAIVVVAVDEARVCEVTSLVDELVDEARVCEVATLAEPCDLRSPEDHFCIAA
jgi:hypothetical protein